MKTYTPEKRIKLGLPSREEAIRIIDHSHIEITMGQTVTIAEQNGLGGCGQCRVTPPTQADAALCDPVCT